MKFFLIGLGVGFYTLLVYNIGRVVATVTLRGLIKSVKDEADRLMEIQRDLSDQNHDLKKALWEINHEGLDK